MPQLAIASWHTINSIHGNAAQGHEAGSGNHDNTTFNPGEGLNRTLTHQMWCVGVTHSLLGAGPDSGKPGHRYVDHRQTHQIVKKPTLNLSCHQQHISAGSVHRCVYCEVSTTCSTCTAAAILSVTWLQLEHLQLRPCQPSSKQEHKSARLITTPQSTFTISTCALHELI